MKAAKGKLWKNIGIQDALLLSCSVPTCNKSLVSVVAYFWTPSYNASLFRSGTAKIMLHDIFALTGLRLDDREIDGPCHVVDLPLFDTNLSYGPFIKT